MGVPQVKFFKGVENSLDELERDINVWLAEFGGTLISVSGNIAPQSAPFPSDTTGLTKSSFAPSDVLVFVVYETT